MRRLLCAVAVSMLLAVGVVRVAWADEVPDPSPLALGEVLRSVDAHYPLLRAAFEERARAAGGRLGAQGAFDLNLRAESTLQPAGFYESYSGGVLVEQPTTIWGTKLFAGYRIGRGDFAVYDGDRATKDGGEFRAGLAVPLLRDGAIDGARARLRQSEIDVAAAEPKILTERIEFMRLGSRAYWRWVAAGRRVEIARRLLQVAEDRQAQLSGRVARGAAPEIDLADNERLIVSRQVRQFEAERAAQQAAIDLSLFLRDGAGAPLIVSEQRVPDGLPAEDAPDATRLTQDIAAGLDRNPVLRELDLDISRKEVDRRLASNALLPRLDVSFGVSQDVGGESSVDDKDEVELKATVGIEVPLQRREARGELGRVDAELRQLTAERRFAGEKVTASIRSAFVALETAYAQLGRAKENQRLALRLMQAEERKLTLGTSNLINVNIREVQAADAAADVVGQVFRYFAALADYRAAIAVDPADTTPLSLP